MKTFPTRNVGLLKRNDTYEGKTIEQQLAEKMAGEEIEMGGKQLFWTFKKDGVLSETNIRTDKWDILQSAREQIERNKAKTKENFAKKPEGGGESTPGKVAKQ